MESSLRAGKLNTTNDIIEELKGFYIDSPGVNFLVQVLSGFSFGVAGGFHAALVTTIQNYKKERLKTYFDELAKGNIDLTEEDIQNEDFLHAFFATTKAASATRNREKIKLFAKLFGAYCSRKQFDKIDEYEEWLSILEDITYREFQILLVFKHNPPNEILNNAKKQEYYQLIGNKVGIASNEVESWLFRLERTGLCTNLGGWDGGIFELRSNFDSLLKALALHEDH